MQRFHPGHKFSAKERTADVWTEEQVDFESLLLSPFILKGLADSGFEKPSPIQLKAIPLGRCGLDLIAQAKSGTGKTCVFSVIALENVLLENPATQVLILAPTREIAVQIKDVVNAIGCHMKGLSCQVFIGGLSLEDDKKALKGCQIAVGSPGRIKNLIENKHLKTDSIRMFILDEADKLLDENFQEQINWIFSTLPANKQMMAFSATYPEYLANHLTRYMREPTFVRLNASDPTLQGIKQFYHVVPFYQLPHKIFQEKVEHLLRLLSKVNFHQCLLFSNFQIRAQSLSSTLCAKGWPATFIAGSLTQEKRLQAMEKLKAFKCRILISTDLTARGIDAENVNLVVNMDVPRDGETYLHRIGRAGRFGTKGVAVTFVAKGKEEEKFREIEKSIGITMEPLPDHIPDSLMISDSLPSANQVQVKQDTVEVNVLHKSSTATTDKEELPTRLISNGKGNISNRLKEAEDHVIEHRKVDFGTTCDNRDTFVHENGNLSPEAITHNGNEHSDEQLVIKSGFKNNSSGKQETSVELPPLEEFEKDFEEYLAMASTFGNLDLQDNSEGSHGKQTAVVKDSFTKNNDQVKESYDCKNKHKNGYNWIDEGADKDKPAIIDNASRKHHGIFLTSKDTAGVNDKLNEDKDENIDDKVENDSSDEEEQEEEQDDDEDDDDDDDDEEEEEEEDDEEEEYDEDDDDDDDKKDDYYDEEEEEETNQNLKCTLTKDQSNISNVIIQTCKDKNYNDTKASDSDGHSESDQQPSDDDDEHDDNATADDAIERDDDDDEDHNAIADVCDDDDSGDDDGSDGDDDDDNDDEVNNSGGSNDNGNQEYDINYYNFNDISNMQCGSSTNHDRDETFYGKQRHVPSQGTESFSSPCQEKPFVPGRQWNSEYPADSYGNSMGYHQEAYMHHRTASMPDHAASEGSGMSGLFSHGTLGHRTLHQGSHHYIRNNMGNVGYEPSSQDECHMHPSMHADLVNQHRETSWSDAWHNAYYQINNAIQQFAALNSRTY